MTVFYTAHITPPCLFSIGSTQWDSAYTPNCLESLPLNFKLTCPDFCPEAQRNAGKLLHIQVFMAHHTSRVKMERSCLNMEMFNICCSDIAVMVPYCIWMRIIKIASLLRPHEGNELKGVFSVTLIIAWEWYKWHEMSLPRRLLIQTLNLLTERCKIWGKSAASRLIAKAWILSSSALCSGAERGTLRREACQVMRVSTQWQRHVSMDVCFSPQSARRRWCCYASCYLSKEESPDNSLNNTNNITKVSCLSLLSF